MKTLSEEAIAILYDDGLLSHDYIESLAFRVQEYLTRELKTIKKKFHHHYLGIKLKCPAKRPRKLDLSWINRHMFHD